MKGAATTMGSITIIVVMLTFFGIYLYMANTQQESNIKLNLESLEALKLKSTFFTMNKSIGTTWFISTVQTVFATADESIGCGYPDARVQPGYWYQGRADAARDTVLDSDGNPIERIPATEKYNGLGRNPQICFPRDNHVLGYLNTKLSDGEYADIIDTIDAGGVTIQISNVQGSMELKDESVDSRFTQRIIAQTTNGKIDKQTENRNTVKTSLKKMAENGRSAAEQLLLLGDSFFNDITLRYIPTEAAGGTQNEASFRSQRASFLSNAIKASAPHREDVLKTEINVFQTKLYASSEDFGGQILPADHGLIMIYNMTILYSELDSPGTPTPTPTIPVIQWPTNTRILNSCFGFRNDPITDVGKFHSGIDIAPTIPGENEPVLSAFAGEVVAINRDCEVGEVSCQKPGHTGYGNFVLIKHADDLYTYYAHLQDVSVTEGETISVAGQQIGTMGTTGLSTGVHLHFEVRRDPGVTKRVDPCGFMDCTESVLLQCSVRGGEANGIYYYHDEDANSFSKRPITLEVGAEDHTPALNCFDWAGFFSNPIFHFNYKNPNDMVCCAGFLFSCNVDIEGQNPSLRLVTGQSIQEDPSDPVSPHTLCFNRLGGAGGGVTLTCTDSGFTP